MKKIRSKKESTLCQIDNKIRVKQTQLDTIIDEIDTETRKIHSYIDTFYLSPMDRSCILHKLVNSRIKLYTNSKQDLIFYIQEMTKKRKLFIENITELENIELAFMNDDYKNIVQLWNTKILKSVNSLESLFSLLQFSLEERTVLFVKKYLNIDIMYTHICCFYEVQTLVADITLHRDPLITTTLYHSELGVKNNADNLKELLYKSKDTFKEIMLPFYRQFLPHLNDDILLLIIRYIFTDYIL